MINTQLSAKIFSNEIYTLKNISKKTIEEHLKLYQGYVNKYNEISTKLTNLTDDDYAKANQVFSNIRELKTELSFAWGGVINHEIYFSHLGGSLNQKPANKLADQINIDFGSYENYLKDLKATGLAARGWVWTGYNLREKKLFNYLGDSQNTFLVWDVKPILALVTYEHAYFMDFGVNRSAYIDAFIENVNWTIVEKNFQL